MTVPFPCPKSINELKFSKKGFFCDDCKRSLVDLKNGNNTILEKDSCVITYEAYNPQESSTMKTYRFALAFFIVLGSSIILNTNAQAQEMLDSVNEIKESFIQKDTNSILVTVQFQDTEGKPIKPVTLKFVLANGQEITQEFNRSWDIYTKLPKHQINKTIKVSVYYFQDIQEFEITLDDYLIKLGEITFKRNKKDRYTSKRYPVTRTIGTPSF